MHNYFQHPFDRLTVGASEDSANAANALTLQWNIAARSRAFVDRGAGERSSYREVFLDHSLCDCPGPHVHCVDCDRDELESIVALPDRDVVKIQHCVCRMRNRPRIA